MSKKIGEYKIPIAEFAIRTPVDSEVIGLHTRDGKPFLVVKKASCFRNEERTFELYLDEPLIKTKREYEKLFEQTLPIDGEWTDCTLIEYLDK